jgi:membrane fusion protein, multidrug efflux system
MMQGLMMQGLMMHALAKFERCKKVPVVNNSRAAWYHRSLVVLSLAIFSIASFGLTSCSRDDKSSEKSGSGASSESGEKKDNSQSLKIPTVKVEMHKLDRSLDLPGELHAYQDVPMHAKVEGFIAWIGVDRGSTVKRGQKLMIISCPELREKEQEAQAKVSAARAGQSESEEKLLSARSKLVEAQARHDSDSLTLQRLQEASKTPGAIAQNDIDMQAKTLEADLARVASLNSEIKASQALVVSQKNNVTAAENVVESLTAMRSYLTILAPFDGVVTERNVHEGSIVAVDSSRGALPLVRVQEKKILRLVVAVPEECVSGLKNGADVEFTVPAFLGKTFHGKIARLGFALDERTRTMPVELNVDNSNGELEPGMFATVHWHTDRPYQTMFVPSPAVANTLKGTFMIGIDAGGVAHVISVSKGQSMGNLVEIVGKVHAGDTVLLTATDEYKEGQHLETRPAESADLEKAMRKSGGGGE